VTKKDRRGGARPGAGRQGLKNPKRVMLSLSEQEFEEIQRIAGEEKTPIATMLRGVILDWLKRTSKRQ